MKSKKLNRRGFLKVATIGGGVLASGTLVRQVHNQLGCDFQPERAQDYLAQIRGSLSPQLLPNIVIILCDDLGLGDMLSPNINTSNLERMAAEGVTLSDFYACASVCSPSRAGLLTGRYPVRTLIPTPLLSTHDIQNIVLDVTGYYSYNVQGIPKDEVLLPEALQRKGYHTALIGKWHLGGNNGYLPNDRGFDKFYGALWSNDDPPYAIYRNREVEIPAPADQNTLTHNFTIEAQNFITDNKDQPFFLYLAHVMPHYPAHASTAFQGTSDAGLYGDAVQEIDWSVGQVMDTLKQAGVEGSTLVVFSSDNGPWMQGSSGYQRGRKFQWFEGGFRVPFIARWPGVIPPAKNINGVAVNFDLYPTCLNIAGIIPPQDRIIDGKDILPLLKGEASSPHDTFYYYGTRTLAAVRYDQHKYVRRHLTDIATYWPTKQGPFLFDLSKDPNESYSLIESEPRLADKLSTMLDNFDDEMKSNLRGWL
jgi:arylsulfatase A